MIGINSIQSGRIKLLLENNTIKKVLSFQEIESNYIEIDLNNYVVKAGNNEYKFIVDPFKRKCLLEGLDDIALSLEKSDQITNFENKIKQIKPWLYK